MVKLQALKRLKELQVQMRGSQPAPVQPQAPGNGIGDLLKNAGQAALGAVKYPFELADRLGKAAGTGPGFGALGEAVAHEAKGLADFTVTNIEDLVKGTHPGLIGQALLGNSRANTELEGARSRIFASGGLGPLLAVAGAKSVLGKVSKPVAPRSQAITPTPEPLRLLEYQKPSLPALIPQEAQALPRQIEYRSTVGEVRNAPQPITPQERFSSFVHNQARLLEKESRGQDLLDVMEEQGISPQSVIQEFWEKTYPTLSVEQQVYAQRLLKRQTGFSRGDVLYTKKLPDGSVESFKADTWEEIGKETALDYGPSAEHLEGTQRGYVVELAAANAQGKARLSLPPNLIEMHAGITPKDIQAGLEAIKNTKIVDDVVKVLAPSTRGDAAKTTALSMRANLAEMARASDRTEAALQEAKVQFDKQPAAANYDFIDKMEAGAQQADPTNQPFADALRKGLDERRDAIRALGTGKLDNFIDDYFPHIWEDPGKAKDFIGQFRRPLEGSKTFLKQRTIPTTMEGLNAGLKPVSDNPVDLALTKMREMDKYLMAHRVLGEMKDAGTSQFVRTGHAPPDGWVRINDKVSSVYYKTAKGELVQSGSYYSPEPAARIVNNYLSPGLRSGSALFKAYMGAGNLLNQAQLGLSAFHLGFTSLDASISKAALGLNNLAHGNVFGAAKNFAETPIAPVANVLKGRKLYNEWFSPGSAPPEFAKYVDALQAGGGRARMDSFYRTGIGSRMKELWRKGNYAGGALRLPGAALEYSAKPIMEYIVPRQKLGVFADLAKMEMERNPNMTPAQMRETMSRVWNSVDNRMGQLVYDNIFWDNATKDLGMASVRSLGWNVGTIREVGGGLADFGKAALDAAQLKKPDFTYRMAYTTALPVTVGVIGGMINYLMTGEQPRELKDYFFPRTGGHDESGDPQRVSLPSYMKDLYHYYDDPGRTIKNKLHPMLGAMGDMLANEDFYGVKIRNEDDPWVQQALDVVKYGGKQFLPLGVRNLQRNVEVEGKVTPAAALPFVGITPAPRTVNETPAERMAQEYVKGTLPNAPRTKQQAEKSRLKWQIRRDIRNSGTQNPASLKEAIAAGKLTRTEGNALRKSAKETPLERSMKSMPLAVALKVYQVTDSTERSEIKQLMRTKVDNFKKNASREDRLALWPMIQEFEHQNSASSRR